MLGIPGFLDPQTCRALREEIRAGELAPALVRVVGAEAHVNREHRKAYLSRVSSRAHAVVNEALRCAQPWISNHFQLPLAGFEEAQFLLYEPGDFFGVHADGPLPGEYGLRWNCRKISVIVFLNGEIGSTAEAAFTGGSLSFHRLEGGGAGVFPIMPAEGLLVAFPSYQPHEVLPVSRGDRLTVVSWFF